MNLVIPTVKTILEYRFDNEGEIESKTVLLDSFLEEDHEWYSDHATVQNNVPFEQFEDSNFECFLVSNGHYRLVEFESGNGWIPKEKLIIEVFLKPVLEFRGLVFKLEETEYDMTESEVGL